MNPEIQLHIHLYPLRPVGHEMEATAGQVADKGDAPEQSDHAKGPATADPDATANEKSRINKSTFYGPRCISVRGAFIRHRQYRHTTRMSIVGITNYTQLSACNPVPYPLPSDRCSTFSTNCSMFSLYLARSFMGIQSMVSHICQPTNQASASAHTKR